MAEELGADLAGVEFSDVATSLRDPCSAMEGGRNRMQSTSRHLAQEIRWARVEFSTKLLESLGARRILPRTRACAASPSAPGCSRPATRPASLCSRRGPAPRRTHPANLGTVGTV